MTKTVKHGIFLVSLFASIGMLVFGHYAYGFSNERPFGGRITQITQPPVLCNGTGVITIQPVGGASASPWSINAQSRSWVGSATPNAWVLGFYNPTIDTQNCYTQVGPKRVPYSTTVWTRYGTSSFGSFGF